MRRFASLLILMLTLSACVFDVPLTEEHDIPIDAGLLGLWEALPNETDKSEKPDRLLVLKFSDTEYLVEHLNAGSSIYFRAYLVEVAGVRAVQLQVIGDNIDPVGPGDSDLYSVVSYELSEDELTITELNTRLVNKDLPSTEALRQAFEAQKDAEDLFIDPLVYRKL